MRVLHCIYDDPANPWVGGGGSLRVRELYRRLADRIDVTVATGRFPGSRDEVLEGVRHLRLGMSSPYALSRLTYGAAATRLLHAGGFDVGVFDFSGYTPIHLPRGRPTAIVVHMLHGGTSVGRWGRAGAGALGAFERWMLRRTRDVCVTSEWLRRELSAVLPDGTRFHLVRSGVPEDFFRVARREQDYLLYYGRFDVYQKGLDVLLEAIGRLRSAGIAPPLHMLGRGRDLERLRALVTEHGLQDQVTIRVDPPRDEVHREMAGALALVHPSRFEGLPMVPAEAMAAAVPVIATDVGAVSEVLDGGRGGLLVPAGDPLALADALRTLLTDDARRASLGSAARASAARFHWDRVAEEHLEFLRAIAATGRNRGQK